MNTLMLFKKDKKINKKLKFESKGMKVQENSSFVWDNSKTT